MASVYGLEPQRTVLETAMLPLHHTEKLERIIRFELMTYTLATCRTTTVLYPQSVTYQPIAIVLNFLERLPVSIPFDLQVSYDFAELSFRNG